jgi:hypothetical protein
VTQVAGGVTYAEWYAAPREADWLASLWAVFPNGKVKRFTDRVRSADCWAASGHVRPPAGSLYGYGDHPVLMETGICLDGCCSLDGRMQRAEREEWLAAKAAAMRCEAA